MLVALRLTCAGTPAPAPACAEAGGKREIVSIKKGDTVRMRLINAATLVSVHALCCIIIGTAVAPAHVSSWHVQCSC